MRHTGTNSSATGKTDFPVAEFVLILFSEVIFIGYEVIKLLL